MSETMTYARRVAMENVLADVGNEREKQHEKWGEQSLPDGTRNGGMNLVQREQAKNACDRAAREGRCTFAHVITEEFWEVMCEEDTEALRTELVQLAAVAVQWVEAIDRRQSGTVPMTPKGER
jgi:hypothetical protein